MNSRFLSTEFVPKSRIEGVLSQNIKDETLIYDLSTNRAYCLNLITSAIWSLCDGQKDIDQIRKSLKKDHQIDSNEELIRLTLYELNKNDLLVKTKELNEFGNRFDRRKAIKSVGLATAFLLPVINSLVAPAAANAASGSSGAQCGSNCNIGNPCFCSRTIISGSCPPNTTLAASLGVGICAAASVHTIILAPANGAAAVNVCVYANVCVTL